MLLPVTLTMAGVAGVLNAWLAIRTSLVRIAEKVNVGDGGNPRLIARMRAHANFIEYTPFVLVLIAAIELARGAGPWLWAAGAVYMAGRIAHAPGMDRPAPNPLRAGGILVTMVVLVSLSIAALVIVLLH